MKLDFRTNTAEWLSEASRLMGLGPVLVSMGAVLMLILAVFSVVDLMKTTQQKAKSAELPEFTLKRVPISKSVYEDYASTLMRLSPHVQVLTEKNGIRIQIASAEHYSEFMYVLNSIQGVAEGVVWKADEICLAGCSGKASEALVKGEWLKAGTHVDLAGAFKPTMRETDGATVGCAEVSIRDAFYYMAYPLNPDQLSLATAMEHPILSRVDTLGV